VLTAVRWNDIGQSVKLGGLVAITLALLAAGQRFKDAIPMTAQAIFHLGALLIPFDMAAVAILAGRSWQETLLLTSVTSVIGWYGIERAVPSQVLRWCAGGAVVGLAAGIAAVSQIAMPVALAAAAVVAVALRQPKAGGIWAVLAGVLPVAAHLPWPSRIAGAMLDLGFDSADHWQPLVAGIVATLALVVVTRMIPRLEIAWSAVVIAVLTALVSVGGFGSSVNLISLAGLFVGIELLAVAASRDLLWKPIAAAVAIGAEVLAAVATVWALTIAAGTSLLAPYGLELTINTAPLATAAALLGLGWLIADSRRLSDTTDWLTAIAFGSNWSPTTILFPAAILAIGPTLGLSGYVNAAVALALAYWMVATWRAGGTYGAIVLAISAVAIGVQGDHWIAVGIGAVAAALLAFAAQLRVRANDLVSSIAAAMTGALVWFYATADVVGSSATGWPILVVAAGAWALSWIVEARGSQRSLHPANWAGRLSALIILGAWIGADPVVGIVLASTILALSGVDYLLTHRRGRSDEKQLLWVFAASGGVAIGLIGLPITGLVGLPTTWAGVALTGAGFIFVGVGLASPREFELPLSAAAIVASVLGLGMSFGQADAFALALICVGCSTMFVGAALRDMVPFIVGYSVAAVGVVLQLAVWQVDWLEPYLAMPAFAALYIGYRFQQTGTTSWATYASTIAVMSYVSIADRIAGGSAWHAVIAGAVGVFAVIGGGYRRLVGPLVTGSVVLAVVVGYESLGPAALVPTWAWLALGGSVLLAAGVAMERSDTTPLERGQQIRNVITTQFS